MNVQHETLRQDLLRSSRALAQDIDSCTADLVQARMNHDLEAEGKAIAWMESLMVAAEQELLCTLDYLEEDGNQIAESAVYGTKEEAEQVRRDWIDKINKADKD